MVSMGLTIGVRFIEGGKSKRVVIINEIRGRNAYSSGTMKFRTNEVQDQQETQERVMPQDPR